MSNWKRTAIGWVPTVPQPTQQPCAQPEQLPAYLQSGAKFQDTFGLIVIALGVLYVVLLYTL